MINYLARQKADYIVIGWMLILAGWLLLAVGVGAVAMLLPALWMGFVAAAMILVSPLSVAVLIAAGKRQEQLTR